MQRGHGHSIRSAFDPVAQERAGELGLSSPEEMLARTKYAVEGPVGMRDKWNIVLDEVRLGM